MWASFKSLSKECLSLLFLLIRKRIGVVLKCKKLKVGSMAETAWATLHETVQCEHDSTSQALRVIKIFFEKNMIGGNIQKFFWVIRKLMSTSKFAFSTQCVWIFTQLKGKLFSNCDKNIHLYRCVFLTLPLYGSEIFSSFKENMFSQNQSISVDMLVWTTEDRIEAFKTRVSCPDWHYFVVLIFLWVHPVRLLASASAYQQKTFISF